MKKIFTLFVAVTWGILYTHAQDTLNAVKVFEPDTIGTGGLSGMYIDILGAADGNAVFCFHSKMDSNEKLIRTDIYGNVIDITDAPSYSLFTVYNGDTIYITNTVPADVVNATIDDTIAHLDVPSDLIETPLAISSSSSGIYVFHYDPSYRTVGYFVQNILNNKFILSFRNPGYLKYSGFCCCNGEVYILSLMNDGNGLLTYINEVGGDKNQAIVPVLNCSGIAEYRGSLYVYSQTYNAVYRLELPEKITTGIKRPEIKETVNIVSESYYDLLGRRMDTPSGLTIVVTRYTDGTIRTEKKLFTLSR
ncbi:MAG: hypothetical protein J6W42_05120 [Bacteroidaceae bacterium]|nr:hypothetical protein [Bacteroidaceae bacterium]